MHIAQYSWSERDQAVKLGQLIEYKKRNIFLQKYTEDEVGRLVPDLFLFLKKV